MFIKKNIFIAVMLMSILTMNMHSSLGNTIIKNCLRNVDGYLNEQGKKVSLPTHTLSWILGGVAVVAGAAGIVKMINMIESYYFNKKSNEEFIQETEDIIKKFTENPIYIQHCSFLEQVNDDSISDEKKIMDKFFLQEKISNKIGLKNIPHQKSFLAYKSTISSLIFVFEMQKKTLDRRIQYLQSRNDDLTSDVEKIITLKNTLDEISNKLKTLEKDIEDNWYAYQVEKSNTQIGGLLLLIFLNMVYIDFVLHERTGGHTPMFRHYHY